MVKIAQAITKESIENAKALVRDYAESLAFDLDFQNFNQEMDDFPGQYAAPIGKDQTMTNKEYIYAEA